MDFNFPKEIWYKIKSYEHQMLYPDKVKKKAIKNIKFHMYMPYYLSIHDQKDFDFQYNFIKRNNPEYWDMFTNKQLISIILNLNNKARKDYS